MERVTFTTSRFWLLLPLVALCISTGSIADDEELVIARAHAIRVRVGTVAERLASADQLATRVPQFAGDPVTSSEVVFHLAEAIDEDRRSVLARQAIVVLGEIGKSLEECIDRQAASRLQAGGLLELDEAGMRATQAGRLRLNAVIDALLVHVA